MMACFPLKIHMHILACQCAGTWREQVGMMDFALKMMNLSLYNDGFCIENDEFCIENDEFLGGSRGPFDAASLRTST